MNLRELSTLLDLSQTTVSRALNGFPEVSEETRARVKAMADRHGYRPSAAARRLATGQSGTLGMIFPAERNMLGDLLFTEFLGGCVEKAADLGYDMTLAMARGGQSEEAVYRRTVRSARVDAMILSSPLLDDPRPRLLDSLGMPFIIHGRTSAPKPYAHLDIDNEGAFFAATKLLVDLGHRRVALLNGRTEYNYAADRERGHRAALEQRGLVPPEGFICQDLMNEETAHRNASRLLAAPSPPTAFLCSSIAQVIGVRKACSERTLRIGQNISVIAHDDRLMGMRAENFDPPLTATQSSIGNAGRRIVELAIGMLKNPETPLPSEIWPVDLVVRGSTAAPS